MMVRTRYAATFSVLLALCLWHATRNPTNPLSPTTDGDFYHAMALQWGSVDLAPFSYRVLTPTVAGLFPGPATLWFCVISAASVALAAWAVGRTVRALGYDASRWAELALLVSPATYFVVVGPVGSDGVGLAVLALGMMFIVERRWSAVGWVAAVGVLNRETALLLIVPALIVARRDRRTWSTAGVFALAILLAALIRFTPLLYGSTPTPRLQTPSEIIPWVSQDGPLWMAVVLGFAGSVGFLLPWLVRAWQSGQLEVRAALWAIIALVPTLLFASDWARIMSATIPFALLATWSVIARPTETYRTLHLLEG